MNREEMLARIKKAAEFSENAHLSVELNRTYRILEVCAEKDLPWRWGNLIHDTNDLLHPAFEEKWERQVFESLKGEK